MDTETQAVEPTELKTCERCEGELPKGTRWKCPHCGMRPWLDAVVMGSVCVSVGLFLTVTVVLAIVGVPLMVLGGLIVLLAPLMRPHRSDLMSGQERTITGDVVEN
ncbi:hypothetical protein [Haloterrigena salifodinae]|uniref:hypothetical protein n=1 Tax=Haloterrigena salifodinae TaxID=2675099 RepID=UPI000F89B4F8|nr:hypothetical protein [Haloterrigena salifodinae]